MIKWVWEGCLQNLMNQMMGGQSSQPNQPPPKSQFSLSEAAEWVGLPPDYLKGLVGMGTLSQKVGDQGIFFDINDLEPIRDAISKLKSNRFKDVKEAIKKSKDTGAK